VIAHRLGEMEKRRVGTRFMDREVTEEDQAKPLIEGNGIFILFLANFVVLKLNLSTKLTRALMVLLIH